MIPSKHNIISKLKDSNEYFVVNLLSGNADVISEEKYLEFKNSYFTDQQELFDKGYVVEEEKEQQLYKQKYLNFIDDRDKDEIQIFFVPWYICNFACSYCYQDEYQWLTQKLSTDVTDALFNYVKNTFAGRKKYITIFGGEPLLPGDFYRENIKYLIESAATNNLDVAIVTNGYTVADYIDILKLGRIREIQVTLDGTEHVHNQRRFLKDSSPTFAKIESGIDALLENKIQVNLRMVVDKENIHDLPNLAKFAIAKGWTQSPYFKTQLGRNYELHHCQKGSQKLYTRLDLYIDLYHLIKKHPEIIEFHKPAFSISKFLFEKGELPEPLFDSCPACKTEWALDYTGTIYSCTATVGKKGEELGTFYPRVKLDNSKVCDWEERDVLSIEECKNCNLRLACGGGCGSVAKNQTGSVLKPDCRPVKELMELGISLYM